MQIALCVRFVVFFSFSLFALEARALAAEPGSTSGTGEGVLWTDKPVRIDRAKQDLERLPDRRLNEAFPNIMYVPKSVRITDSVTFSYRDEVFRLAHIAPVPSQMVCRAQDGRRWSCGLRARMNLRAMIAGKQFRCRKLAEEATAHYLVECQLANGQTVAELLLRSGSALGVKPIAPDLEQAEAFAISMRAGIWSDADYHSQNQ
ncbi:hypothetical protein [Roseibium polysiphoniae]|uniref:thermonuclease family protein n=1 Tax=Roseibium polysiphoniae TaxID=2571221 RepID=UPI00329A16C1